MEAAVLDTAAIVTGVAAERYHEQGAGPSCGHHWLGQHAGAVRGAVGRPRASTRDNVQAPPVRCRPATRRAVALTEMLDKDRAYSLLVLATLSLVRAVR
jgi:hypothetical protein